jgi:hypothetical protein
MLAWLSYSACRNLPRISIGPHQRDHIGLSQALHARSDAAQRLGVLSFGVKQLPADLTGRFSDSWRRRDSVVKAAFSTAIRSVAVRAKTSSSSSAGRQVHRALNRRHSALAR